MARKRTPLIESDLDKHFKYFLAKIEIGAFEALLVEGVDAEVAIGELNAVKVVSDLEEWEETFLSAMGRKRLMGAVGNKEYYDLNRLKRFAVKSAVVTELDKIVGITKFDDADMTVSDKRSDVLEKALEYYKPVAG